jgi:hypothetical protein
MRRSGGDGARLLPDSGGEPRSGAVLLFGVEDILAEEDETLARWILTDEVLSDDTWYQKDRRSTRTACAGAFREGEDRWRDVKGAGGREPEGRRSGRLGAVCP